MGKNYGADRVTSGALPFTRSLKRVVRDAEGVLRSSTISPSICEGCGHMRVQLLDERGAVFAWIGIAPDQARGIAAALVDMAAESEALGGGSNHKH